MELDKLTDLHFSAHLVDMMLEYRAIGTRYISLQQSCSRGNSLLPWCTTPIEAESSLGPDSHHPIISLSGIPSAVIVLRILHPILASTLCAANPVLCQNSAVPSIYSSARPELDWSSVYRHHTYMISSFVLALISAFKARRELVPADE